MTEWANKNIKNFLLTKGNHEMTFAKWIEIFLSEKGIDMDHIVIAEGNFGANYIPVGCLVDMMKEASINEQKGIKAMLIKIDFIAPGRKPVIDYFTHLAKAIAI